MDVKDLLGRVVTVNFHGATLSGKVIWVGNHAFQIGRNFFTEKDIVSFKSFTTEGETMIIPVREYLERWETIKDSIQDVQYENKSIHVLLATGYVLYEDNTEGQLAFTDMLNVILKE